ncbi:hypothetical protein Adt_30673 [Abeliophyllum distichum]|uniref:No apical meristem-associated C-terminal domain-containing protein n=1 Tax=Abeliophyllum distichum TaxID=126358 RepID=A0ABD1RD39_9LAMI
MMEAHAAYNLKRSGRALLPVLTLNLQARQYYAEDYNGKAFKYENLWNIVKDAQKFQDLPISYDTHDVQTPQQPPINLDEGGGETFRSVGNPMQYKKPMERKGEQAKKDKNVESSNSQSQIANSMEAMAAQALNQNVSRATFYEDHSNMQQLNWS